MNFVRKLAASRLLASATIICFVLYFFYPLRYNIATPHWDTPGGSDALFHALLVKFIISTGWLSYSSELGAPFGTSLLDFPNADATFTLLIKLLGLFTDDTLLVTNLFFIFSFILIFSTTYFVFRSVSFERTWSTAGALIFACAPYHFFRGTAHLYLSSYFVVPIWIWLTLEAHALGKEQARTPPINSWWLLTSLVVLCASSGVYYALFGVGFLLLASLISSIEFRTMRPARFALKVSFIALMTQILNILPSIVYWFNHGLNQSAVARAPIESDLYGLRLIQLILPSAAHRNEAMANFASKYHDALHPVTEGTASALGVIGSLGFILLIVVCLLPKQVSKDDRVSLMARLNLAAVLFATVGGFGVLFAMTVTAQFRGLTRVSIFISFISLLALFIWVREIVARKYFEKTILITLGPIAAACLAGFALYDQIPLGARPPALPKELVNQTYWQQQKDFVEKIERALRPGAMVYVEPYTSFPEATPAFKESYNGMMRLYVYSTRIRWSYGAMKGREGDAWLQTVANLPIKDRLAALKKTGFEGVYVNRRAFPDNGRSIEDVLKSDSGGKVVLSEDGEHAFYPLVANSKTETYPSFAFQLGKGFSQLENNATNSWAWSSEKGELKLYNFSDVKLSVQFRSQLTSLGDRSINVQSQRNRKATFLQAISSREGSMIEVELNLDLEPGTTILRFDSDVPSVKVPGDPRKLAFRLLSPQLKMIESAK